MASSSTPIIIEDKPEETSTVTTQESQNIKKKNVEKSKIRSQPEVTKEPEVEPSSKKTKLETPYAPLTTRSAHVNEKLRAQKRYDVQFSYLRYAVSQYFQKNLQ